MGIVDEMQALRWTEGLIKALVEEQGHLEMLKKSCRGLKKGKYLEGRLANIQTKLQDEVESYIGLREEVLKNLQKLTDRRMHLVLELRYVNYLSWQEIAKRTGFSRRHVLRIIEMGLKKLEVMERN